MKLILIMGKMIARIVVFGLNYVLRALSVTIAVAFGVVYWLIWILTLPLKGNGSQTQAEPLKAYDLSPEITIEPLLGPNAPKKIDAVFEGGGVKALAQVGAVQAIEKLSLSWSKLGGTSGGAIVASLLAANKDSKEIWKLLTEVGLHRFVDVWYLPRVAFLQKRLYLYLPLFANLMFTRGMVSGREFEKTMEQILKKDGDEPLRFRDEGFLNPTRKKSVHRHRLKMVATDISRGTPIVLPDDLPDYWEAWKEAEKSDKPKLLPEDAQDWWPVAKAVRMSMSIPFFFNPVKLHLNVDKDGKPTNSEMGYEGHEVLIVDGGVSSNFPIWLFDRLDKRPSWPTFGFLLDEKKGKPSRPPRVTRFLTDLAMSVIGTGMGAMDKRMSEHDKYRTARLRTLDVSTTKFGLNLAKQMELVEWGFRDTEDFLRDFKWLDYLDRFRRER